MDQSKEVRTGAQKPTSDEAEVLTRTVGNDRIERTYTAYTANGQVFIRDCEVDGGTVVMDDVHGYDLAADGETVVHCGKHWREYALGRFRRLNDARFTHGFTDLRGEI